MDFSRVHEFETRRWQNVIAIWDLRFRGSKSWREFVQDLICKPETLRWDEWCRILINKQITSSTRKNCYKHWKSGWIFLEECICFRIWKLAWLNLSALSPWIRFIRKERKKSDNMTPCGLGLIHCSKILL